MDTQFLIEVLGHLMPLVLLAVIVYTVWKMLRWLWRSVTQFIARPYVASAVQMLQHEHDMQLRQFKRRARERERAALRGAERVARAATQQQPDDSITCQDLHQLVETLMQSQSEPTRVVSNRNREKTKPIWRRCLPWC